MEKPIPKSPETNSSSDHPLTDSYLEITVKVADHIADAAKDDAPAEKKRALGTATMVMTTGIFAKGDEDEPWKKSMRKYDSFNTDGY